MNHFIYSDAIASLARLLRWDDDTTSTSTAARTIASTLSSQLITKHSNSNKGKDHPNKRSRCKNENVANNANLDDEDDGDEARDKVPPLPPPPPVAVTTTTVDPTKRGRRKRRCMGVGNAPPVTSSSTTTTTAAQEDSNSINTSQSMNNNSPSASSSSNRSSTSTTYSIYTSNSNNLDYMGDYNDYDYNIHSNNNRARRKKESSDRSRQKQIKKLLRFVRKRELTLSLEQQQQQESSLFTDNNNNNNNNKVATTPPPVQSTMFMRVPDDITVSWLALKALQTVIMAHNNDSTSDTDEHEHESLSSLNNNNNKLLQKDGNMNNKYKDPMFIHTLLRESESLPHLALALRASCDRASNVLLSLTTTTATTTTSHDNGRSFGFLQDRIIMLTSIIDTVCCLTPDNRTVLCQGTGLVDYMVRLVAACCLSKHYDSSLCSQKKKKRNHNNNNTEELILSCLKAITSLTHENRLAGEQLCKERSWCGDSRYTCDNMMSASSSTCSSEDGVRTPKSGIGIIFRVLELMIRTSDTNGEKDSSISSVSDGYQHHHQLDQKVVYDVRIFCLSILTNAAETGKNARRELSKCTVVCVDGNVNANEQVLHRPAIQWLASWIVDQTHAFRSSLVEAVPSSSSSQKSCNNGEKKKKKFQDDEGDLAAGEEESLNTTGNGFLLLACLLKRWMDCSEEETRVREMILDEMPEVEGSARRVQYIIAGLNAFLNFYHVSLDGALSDAIVTPVVKLIGELKQL